MPISIITANWSACGSSPEMPTSYARSITPIHSRPSGLPVSGLIRRLSIPAHCGLRRRALTIDAEKGEFHLACADLLLVRMLAGQVDASSEDSNISSREEDSDN